MLNAAIRSKNKLYNYRWGRIFSV